MSGLIIMIKIEIHIESQNDTDREREREEKSIADRQLLNALVLRPKNIQLIK